MTDVRIVDAEALVIGPEDRLLIKLPDHLLQDPGMEAMIDHLWGCLGSIGIQDRCLILQGMEFVKMESTPAKAEGQT